jgi:magnesium chelatase family protein
MNLAPSDIRKEGTRFDLPMAVALLLLCKDRKTNHEDAIQQALFFGELGLDGMVKRID